MPPSIHPIVAAIRRQARERFAKAAVRWRCNDYPYAALMSMIDARARVLQLKGVRAGDTVAVHAVRGVGGIVDIAALWSVGASAMIRSGTQGPLPVDESVVRARVAGVLTSDGGYWPTGLVKQGGQPGPASLIFASMGGPEAPVRSRTAGQLEDSMLQAQTVFGLSERTALGLAPPCDEASLLETWYVLANGGTVDLLSESEAICPRLLREHLRESNVDLVQADLGTAPGLQAPPEECALTLPQVRDVILRGSKIGPNVFKLLSDTFPNADLRPMNLVKIS